MNLALCANQAIKIRITKMAKYVSVPFLTGYAVSDMAGDDREQGGWLNGGLIVG